MHKLGAFYNKGIDILISKLYNVYILKTWLCAKINYGGF